MKYYIILFISLVQLCSCDGQAFLDLDQISNNHRIFVTPIPLMIEHFGMDEELKIPQGFVIENKETIDNVTKDWGKKRIEERDFPLYKVFLTKNGEIQRSLSINKDLTILLTGHGSYKFKSELLFKYQNSFRYLNWINIRTVHLSDAKKLLAELKKENFVYPTFVNPESDFQGFQGNIIVKRKKITGEDEYQNIVQQDFNLDSVFVRQMNQIGRDSISLNFWTKTKLPKNVPNNYIVISEWVEFKNIEFEVFGCNQDIVEDVIDKLEIEAEVKAMHNNDEHP